MSAKAEVIGAFGARGCGKTSWMLDQCARDKRLLVWDFKHDEGLRGVGQPFTSMGAMIRAIDGAPAFRFHYLVDHDKDVSKQFEYFCRVAWKAGRLRMFVAELPEVTKANRAPAIWRKCINVGRDYEGGKWLAIIAEAQRLAEVDKSFIGNCDVVHTGRLGNLADCKGLAAMWGCEASELAGMPDFHWIEKRAKSPELHRGTSVRGNIAKKSRKA